MDKSLHELFTEVEETKSPVEKAEILKHHESDGLKAILNTRPYINTYIHTYVHTYIHTYIHT